MNVFAGFRPKTLCINPRIVKILDILGFWRRFPKILVGSWLIWSEKKTADYYFKNYLKVGKIVVIDHAPGKFAPVECENKNVRKVVLSEKLAKECNLPAFYACVFPKSRGASAEKEIDFISVGVIGDPARADADALIEFAAAHPGARIRAVAHQTLGDYPERFRAANIGLRKNASFDFMFEWLRRARFIPFLIHGDKMEYYYKDAISGKLNLALGLSVVPVIDARLAKAYGLDDASAVLYDGPGDFSRAMTRAMRMPADEYGAKVRALDALRERLTLSNRAALGCA